MIYVYCIIIDIHFILKQPWVLQAFHGLKEYDSASFASSFARGMQKSASEALRNFQVTEGFSNPQKIDRQVIFKCYSTKGILICWNGCFRKLWYPQIIHFNRVFHYKPSILGYPYFWNRPNVETIVSSFWLSPSNCPASFGCSLHWCLITLKQRSISPWKS